MRQEPVSPDHGPPSAQAHSASFMAGGQLGGGEAGFWESSLLTEIDRISLPPHEAWRREAQSSRHLPHPDTPEPLLVRLRVSGGDFTITLFTVQSLSHIRLCDLMDCSTPGLPIITNSQSLLKLMSIESVMPCNHLILCRHLLLPPSIFPSIRVFSNESSLCTRWPKYWSFSFNISPSNE